MLPERSHPMIPQPFASSADAAPAAETRPSAETSALPHAARRLTALLLTAPSTPAAMRGAESPLRRAYERTAGRGSVLSASAVLSTRRPSVRYTAERRAMLLTADAKAVMIATPCVSSSHQGDLSNSNHVEIPMCDMCTCMHPSCWAGY